MKNIKAKRQFVRSEALNKIIKMYGQNHGIRLDHYDTNSFAEERDNLVENIVYYLLRDLKDIKKEARLQEKQSQ